MTISSKDTANGGAMEDRNYWRLEGRIGRLEGALGGVTESLNEVKSSINNLSASQTASKKVDWTSVGVIVTVISIIGFLVREPIITTIADNRTDNMSQERRIDNLESESNRAVIERQFNSSRLLELEKWRQEAGKYHQEIAASNAIQNTWLQFLDKSISGNSPDIGIKQSLPALENATPQGVYRSR